MKKTLLFGLLVVLVTSCSSPIKGEGAATAQKEYTADNIKELNVSCNCDIILVPGDKTGVKGCQHSGSCDGFNEIFKTELYSVDYQTGKRDQNHQT